MSGPDMLEAALSYAARGWAVFPLHTPTDQGCSCGNPACKPIGKHPRTQSGLKEASTDPDQITQWWTRWPSANIGIATGSASGGLVVLDVDDRHDGEDSLRAIGEPPDTIEALTGGGRHLYYLSHAPPRNSAGAIGPGLDIRGEGGYVVAPPSLHYSGKRYEWEGAHEPGDTQLALFPSWLLAPTKPKRAPTVAHGQSIPEGQRNGALFALACRLNRAGLGAEAVLSALARENEDRCFPPLDAEEVRSIAASAAKATAGDGARFNTTDLGNAERLVAAHGQDIRYVAGLGWYVWTGQRWAQDATGEVERRAKLVVRAIYDEAARAEDPENRKRLADHARRCESAGKIAAMIELARTEPGVSIVSDQLDADPWALNVENGTIDLRSGVLRPHRREDLLTNLANVTYDPHATAPVFDAFLARVQPDSEVRAYLQRLAGYSLTASVGEECVVFNHGGGANGKSVYSSAIYGMLGSYAVKAPRGLLASTDAGNDRHTTELMPLRGARLSWCSEVTEGSSWDEAKVKDLCSPDPITARLMHRDNVTFLPTHKLWINGNHKPKVTGTDLGIWRRLKLVPWTVTIPDGERDKMLAAKLDKERSGILNWAVAGCLAWQRDGLCEPKAVGDATTAYRDSEDSVGRWLAARCAQEAAAQTAASMLYSDYASWLVSEGEPHVSQTKFGKSLAARGFVKGRAAVVGRYAVWMGLRLLPSDDDADIVGGVGGVWRGCPESPHEKEKFCDFSEKTSKRIQTHPTPPGDDSAERLALYIARRADEELRRGAA